MLLNTQRQREVNYKNDDNLMVEKHLKHLYRDMRGRTGIKLIFGARPPPV